MRLCRFYQPGSYELFQQVALITEAAHHAIHVLRLNTGDKIELFNGKGEVYIAEIKQISKKSVFVTILESLQPKNESPLQIHLYLAIIKSDKMDWMLQKAVELGVTEITPMITEFTDIKLAKERSAKKIEHWQKIIINACGQCERNVLPQLNMPLTFHECLQQKNAEFCLVFDPNAEMNMKQIRFDANKISIFIGPEGGFSKNELTLAKQKACTLVKCGPRILRTETAALTAIILAQSLWGDFYN